jgi:hypothetical protein
MKQRSTALLSVFAMLAFALLLTSSPAQAQDDDRGGSFDVRQHSSLTRPFEILHCSLVRFRLFQRFECPEVLAPPGLRVLLS